MSPMIPHRLVDIQVEQQIPHYISDCWELIILTVTGLQLRVLTPTWFIKAVLKTEAKNVLYTPALSITLFSVLKLQLNIKEKMYMTVKTYMIWFRKINLNTKYFLYRCRFTCQHTKERKSGKHQKGVQIRVQMSLAEFDSVSCVVHEYISEVLTAISLLYIAPS